MCSIVFSIGLLFYEFSIDSYSKVYLPIPVNICQYLSIPVITCQYLLIPGHACLVLLCNIK